MPVLFCFKVVLITMWQCKWVAPAWLVFSGAYTDAWSVDVPRFDWTRWGDHWSCFLGASCPLQEELCTSELLAGDLRTQDSWPLPQGRVVSPVGSSWVLRRFRSIQVPTFPKTVILEKHKSMSMLCFFSLAKKLNLKCPVKKPRLRIEYISIFSVLCFFKMNSTVSLK